MYRKAVVTVLVSVALSCSAEDTHHKSLANPDATQDGTWLYYAFYARTQPNPDDLASEKLNVKKYAQGTRFFGALRATGDENQPPRLGKQTFDLLPCHILLTPKKILGQWRNLSLESGDVSTSPVSEQNVTISRSGDQTQLAVVDQTFDVKKQDNDAEPNELIEVTASPKISIMFATVRFSVEALFQYTLRAPYNAEKKSFSGCRMSNESLSGNSTCDQPANDTEASYSPVPPSDLKLTVEGSETDISPSLLSVFATNTLATVNGIKAFEMTDMRTVKESDQYKPETDHLRGVCADIINSGWYRLRSKPVSVED